MLLDDLQWADDSSLELVAHLLRRPPRAPLLVACAFRSGGLAPAVLGAFEAAGRDGRVRRRAARAAHRRRVRRAARRRAAGARARGAVRAQRRQPLLPRSSSRAAWRPIPRPRVPAPGSGAAARRRRRARAGAGRAEPRPRGCSPRAPPWPATRPSSGSSAAAGDLPEPDVAGALDELVGKRLLSPGALPRRYRFRHPIVRRAAYESGGEGWRLAAHRRAAGALERTGGPLGARAHHLERCAEPGDDDAFAVLAQAGHAAAPNAPAEAARWYTAALRLLPERRRAAARGARAARHRARVDRAARAGARDAARRARHGAARSWPSCARGSSPPARRARTCSAATARRTSGSSTRWPSCPSAPARPSPMLEAELAADALYDSDFAALGARAAQARATAGTLEDPGLRVLTAALDCFAHYGLGRMPAGRGGARRRRGDARRDGRRPARRAARGVLLPGLRRAAVRALRRRDPPHRARRGASRARRARASSWCR